MIAPYGGLQPRRLQDKPLAGMQPLTGMQPVKPNIAPTVPALTGQQPMLPRPNIAPMAPQSFDPNDPRGRNQGMPQYGGATPPPGLPRPQQQPPSGLSVNPGIAGPNVGPTPPPPTESGGPLTDFGPGNDLLSTQVNPTTGERLGGVQSGNDVLYKALTQGPNLGQAALDQFKNIQSQTSEQRQRGIQDIGRSAARLGRLGSGMVTTDLGNLEDTLRSHENQALGDLAYNTATQESANTRANLGAGQGYESQLYGQGQNARNEVRTERDYQAQQSQQALQNEIVRRQLQAQYQQYLASLGLQGAGLYGDQAAASQGAASSLLGF